MNKLSLAGDKFMPEIRLRQPGFTYCARGPFTKNKQRIKILKKQVIQDIFINTNQIKLVLNMIRLMEILGLPRRTAADKVLHNKAFNIAKDP